MNKNFKVIQINGLSGLLLLGILLIGIFCGFVLFPIWMIMIGWNEVVYRTFSGPSINYFQAALLWSAVALSLYILLKNTISIKFQRDETANSNMEIKEIINEMHQDEAEEEFQNK